MDDGEDLNSGIILPNGEVYTIDSDSMDAGRTVLLENPINAHESEIKFVHLK